MLFGVLCYAFGCGTVAYAAPSKGGITDKVRLLRIYEVHDGKARDQEVTSLELGSGDGILVKGYVNGIEVVCEEEMVVRVDGQKATKMGRTTDSPLSAKSFAPTGPSANPGSKTDPDPSAGNGKPTGVSYCYFPPVKGDAVSGQDRFTIAFELDGAVMEVPIRQTGYRTLQVMPEAGAGLEPTAVFRYLGSRIHDLSGARDFQGRAAALSTGIDNVERTFGKGLVTSVNIVDYSSLKNAVVCEDEKGMWIYRHTFEKESPEELVTIGQHEALHILVEMERLTRGLALREHFAQLLGYDDLSIDRFLLVTKGIVPPNRGKPAGASRKFFSFITERNYLAGAKGGHAEESIEEFCASFFHSLMHIERLERNLRQPVRLHPAADSVPLTLQDRTVILQNYVKTIEAMLDSVDPEKGRTGAFLKSCLFKVRALLQKGAYAAS
jgi:hypothetical protein